MNRIITAILIIFLASVVLAALSIFIWNGTKTDIDTVAAPKEEKKELAIGETILVSYDEGEHWQKAKFPGNFNLNSFFLSKKNPGRVYAVTDENGIYVKEKNSDVWEALQLKNPETGSKFYVLTEDGKDNIYLGYYKKNVGFVLRYNLKNKKEEDIFKTPLQKYAVFGITASDDGENLNILVSDGGFYESRDAGFSWSILKRFEDGLLDFAKNEFTGDIWIATSKGRVLKILSGKKIFKDVSDNLIDFDKADIIEDLAYDQNGNRLYLASGYGILKSENGDGKWKTAPLIVPPESLPIKSVIINPFNKNIIYAGSFNQFYKSDDDGFSWRIITLPTQRAVSQIEVDLLDTKTIYAGLK